MRIRKSSRGRREQPQLDLDRPAETEDAFSLEDILNEFGGWSKPEAPPEAAESPAGEAAGAAERELAALLEDEEPADAPPQDEAASPASEKPSPFQFIRLEDAKADKTQPPAGAPPRRGPRPVPEKPPKAEKAPKPKKPPRPAPEYPPPEVAYKAAGRGMNGLILRRRLACLLCLAAMAVAAWSHLGLSVGGRLLPTQLAAQILMGLLLAGVLTAYDVMLRGVYQLLRLRPDLDTLLAVSAVVFAVDGFLHMSGEKVRLSQAAVLLLALFFALWGRVAGRRARRRSLKAVLSMDEKPQAAVLSRRAWGSRDCIFRAEGDRSGYVAELESPSCVDRAMEIYAPSVICLSLVLSLLMHFLRQRDFLACWTTMLAGAIPVAAAITYPKPFAALARRLLHAGAALCGWQGARRLTGPCCVAMEDGDLFSKANISMNGMKMFSEHSVARVVGYTYAVIAHAGSGLEPVFHEVFVNQNGAACTIDSFRRYEGGGVGAEIQGDVVLVGSLAFMRAMGVQMPEGTNVRQAVYCAVNQELAAVFALNYTPSGVVRSGFQTILRNKGLSLLLATRDFILTPDMVRHKYKLPVDCMEYPSVEERVRLSGPYAAAGGEQTALLTRDSFLPLAEAVSGGRSLSSSVWGGLWVNLLGGVLGFVITAVLAWLGAFDAASVTNLALYALLWTLPALLVSSVAGK